MTLREKLMHYTHDLDCGADLKQEAIATIEHIAQYMDEDELLHHSRPLAIAYLALTEDNSVPVVHGRLIDADAILKADENSDKALVLGSGKALEIAYALLKKKVADAPTVDAVPVVRCKDCKWFADNNDGEWYGCQMFQVVRITPEDAPKPDDFCSYGERKENNHEKV